MSPQACTHGGAPCPRIVEQLRVDTGAPGPEAFLEPGYGQRPELADLPELTQAQVDEELEQQYRWGYL